MTDALAAAVRTLVRREIIRDGESPPGFDPALWRQLGQMGVFGLATDEGGTAGDLCRCVAELGAAGVVGPVVETLSAAQVDLGVDTAAVRAGERIATVTWDAELVPWGGRADVIVMVRDARAHRADVADARPVVTLAGDPWTAGRVTPAEDLGPATAATAAADLAVAAYVSAAGLRIVEICAEYAATRRQFGRAIGDYQAVSQPLAEAYSRLAGIRDVLDGPFDDVDLAGPGTGERAARVRLIAVGAATHASYVGFQTQGGMGFVDGTELAHLGKRIRQIALAGEPRAAGIERAVGRLIA